MKRYAISYNCKIINFRTNGIEQKSFDIAVERISKEANQLKMFDGAEIK